LRFSLGASPFGAGCGTGFAGNFFPFFHWVGILSRCKAGAMMDSRGWGFPGAGIIPAHSEPKN
jgi:hypothetical protein